MFWCRLRSESEDDLQTELHPPAPAIEDRVVQKEITCRHERVSGAQWVRILVLIDRTVIRGQPDAGVGVVESVKGCGSELGGPAFRKLDRLDNRHVPDIQTRSSNGISAHSRLSTRRCLYVACSGIRGYIANGVSRGACSRA